MKTIFALAFLFCVSLASGLKCYFCESSTSFEDCDKNKTEITCPTLLGATKCFKSEMVYGNSKQYGRGCQLKTVCDNKDTFLELCKAGGGNTCELNCCDDKDLCNGGTVLLVSLLLMVPCTLMAFFR